MTTESISKKQLKKNMTAYWAIELSISEILTIPQIQQKLLENEQLKCLEKIHSTLLYVGKKENPLEEKFYDYENQECEIEICGFGYSDKAVAIEVIPESLLTMPEQKKIPSHAEKQHITIALSQGIPAKDSVKTLLGDGNIIYFSENIKLHGKIKRFLF